MKPTFNAFPFTILATTAIAADWPTYRGAATRSGYTAETIPNRLRLRWTV